jgi:hypothetical protein
MIFGQTIKNYIQFFSIDNPSHKSVKENDGKRNENRIY